MADQPDRDQFEAAVRPMMEYLAKNHHPHTHIVVTANTAELSEGVIALNTDEYLRD